MNVTSPAWWAMFVSSILAVAGVSDPGLQANVKMVVTGGAALIIAVYQWQHHRTLRHSETIAGQVARAKIAATAPPAPDVPAGAVVHESGLVHSAPPVTGTVVSGIQGAPPA